MSSLIKTSTAVVVGGPRAAGRVAPIARRAAMKPLRVAQREQAVDSVEADKGQAFAQLVAASRTQSVNRPQKASDALRSVHTRSSHLPQHCDCCSAGAESSLRPKSQPDPIILFCTLRRTLTLSSARALHSASASPALRSSTRRSSTSRRVTCSRVGAPLRSGGPSRGHPPSPPPSLTSPLPPLLSALPPRGTHQWQHL
jgi:hypothetical protein